MKEKRGLLLRSQIGTSVREDLFHLDCYKIRAIIIITI